MGGHESAAFMSFRATRLERVHSDEACDWENIDILPTSAPNIRSIGLDAAHVQADHGDHGHG
jgi:hypothetical protein